MTDELELEEKSLEHLANIEEGVAELADKIPGPRRSFLNGVLQGMGAVIGSLLAVALLGWFLSAIGIIPGMGVIADHVQEWMRQAKTYQGE